MLAGYARVSTQDQNLDIQIEQLKAAGCDKIFTERRSGTTTEGRDALAAALEFVREGDVLVVARLDRLARSLSDLLIIMATLEKKGVGFRCIHQPVDTTTPAGRMFIAILGAISEFETELRKERQAEGVAKAKAAGRYTGGRCRVDPSEIRRLRIENGLTAVEIAKKLRCGKKTVYRYTEGLWGPSPIPRNI